MAAVSAAPSPSNPINRLLGRERSFKAWLQQQCAPIEPIGVCETYCLLRNPAGEVVALRPSQFGCPGLLHLFAEASSDLERLFPGEGGNGWDGDVAAEVIMAACHECGIVDPRTYGFDVVYRRQSYRPWKIRKPR